MRQRNVKNKEEIINNSRYIVLSPEEYIGCWSKVFNNNNPIYIEIGMGKGQFILENAKKYPNINFIGIERYDSIIALALKKIDKEDLKNLLVIRMDANNIDKVFDGEVDKIFLNFSDPWPKKRHERKRLTYKTFLEKYERLLAGKGIICMKTDNRALFDFSLESFEENGWKLRNVDFDYPLTENKDDVPTEYERRFRMLDNPICRV